jgi:hypothetical protein
MVWLWLLYSEMWTKALAKNQPAISTPLDIRKNNLNIYRKGKKKSRKLQKFNICVQISVIMLLEGFYKLVT